MTTVIARFPTYKALAYFVGCFMAMAFFFVATAYLLLNDFLRQHGDGWLLAFIVGWLAAIVGLLMLFALLRQILFARSCAVWSDDESIFYLHKHFLAVRKDSLEGISLGTFGRFNSPAIILALRDGRARVIPTSALSEAPEVILARLRKAIWG